MKSPEERAIEARAAQLKAIHERRNDPVAPIAAAIRAYALEVLDEVERKYEDAPLDTGDNEAFRTAIARVRRGVQGK